MWEKKFLIYHSNLLARYHICDLHIKSTSPSVMQSHVFVIEFLIDICLGMGRTHWGGKGEMLVFSIFFFFSRYKKVLS